MSRHRLNTRTESDKPVTARHDVQAVAVTVRKEKTS